LVTCLFFRKPKNIFYTIYVDNYVNTTDTHIDLEIPSTLSIIRKIPDRLKIERKKEVEYVSD